MQPSNEDGLAVLTQIAANLDLRSDHTTWTPSRPADFNFKAWGVWECWEHAKIGAISPTAIGAIATGDWIAWNACTGQQFGFPGRAQAETMAVLQNENAPTRIVFLDGSSETSRLDFDEISSKVAGELARMQVR